MSVIDALILGIMQGLCEFLPISSTGHLTIFQNLLGITEASRFFTVMLHIGTLAAVLVVYRKRIIEMIAHPIKQSKYWIWMIVSTLVTVVMQLLFGDYFELAEDGRLLGYSYLFTSILLILCDFIRKNYRMNLTVNSMKWYHSLLIGFLQGVAILPGVSRSGATITGATLCKMDSDDAAEFSFLLSIPAILGGAVLEVPDAIAEGSMGANLLPIIIGVAVAAISGYFAVRFMIKLITRHSFKGFAVYTALLGLYLIIDWNVVHFIFK